MASLVLIAACASAAAAPVRPVSGKPETISILDDVGTTVTVASVPRRVVCLSPGATEIIYALGAQDRLVAVCSLCDYPPAARDLPRVGDFMNLSLEAIIAARPDLVVATGGVQKELVLRLREAGIPAAVMYPHSVRGILGNMGMLGRLLGVEPVARELVRHMGTRLAISARRGHGAAARNGPVRVYFEVSADPLMAMGAGSYVGDLITLAGGKNIVRDLGGEYPQISPEFIVAMDPQVIILSHAANPARALEEVRRRPGWGNLSAVREGRVYADLDMDSIMRPGPRIISGAAQLQQRFYPDK